MDDREVLMAWLVCDGYSLKKARKILRLYDECEEA